jgi:mono/diheme cytochrome c family protein
MHIFLLKSLLSFFVIILTCVAMFTMFEVFGRQEKKYNVASLKKIHRINGYIFLFFFLFVSYLCIDFIVNTKADLPPRSAIHATLGLAIFILLFLKIIFVRFYKLYYNKVQVQGLLIAVLTFGLVGTSAGYYIAVSKFGLDKAVEKVMERNEEIPKKAGEIEITKDPESVKRGKEMYDSKCYSCHDPFTRATIIGPGHQGILKDPVLPVSRKDATPENIALQLRQPYNQMPSFAYLSDDEIADIIAFLHTL